VGNGRFAVAHAAGPWCAGPRGQNRRRCRCCHFGRGRRFCPPCMRFHV